ncbi:MAG: DUF3313 domain-containing protein [Phycisphaerales bacterium]|nr:DUF3313 domain-containing protein [Phycisphaerales bacterium]
MSSPHFTFFALFLTALLGGCSSAPEARQTGFLSDYQHLEKTAPQRMGYLSPDLRDYTAFIVEEPRFLTPPGKLSETDRADLARHLHTRILEILETRGFAITDAPAARAGRVRIAITDIAESTWWMKVHPGARIAGAGTGGAAMEGEVVDSQTGRQLAAAVIASPASQFDLTAFSTVADVKNTIDDWARQAGRRLDTLLASPTPGPTPAPAPGTASAAPASPSADR